MRNLIQQYAKDLTAGRLSSGYEHSYRIYHLAREIGEDTGYDDEILHAACFLHDVENAGGHPGHSADKARAILVETGFPSGKIQAVYNAVLNHKPGGKPDSTEAKLLHDANLLDTIGAIGFARLSIGSFFWYHYRTMAEVLELLKKWLEHAETLYFENSKKIAVKKKEFLKAAIKQFSKELVL